MRTLKEIEEFLENETKSEYQVAWDRDQKQAWIVANPNLTKRLVFRLRSCGRQSWTNFLWAFGLEESISISKVGEAK